MNNSKILVIEDDKAIRNLIRTTLETQNYSYHTASTGQGALLEAVTYQPDLILLDLGLPDMDGSEILTKIRSWSNIPIIILSARSNDQDKINCLDLGADDYLSKPFSINELLARLRAHLRRSLSTSSLHNTNNPVFTNGYLKINYTSRVVSINDQEIHLTPIEYNLLCLLSKNIGKVLTHNYILSQVWNSSLSSDTPSLRVFMATLRKKIELPSYETKYIQTHTGIGYKMLHVDSPILP